MSRLSKLKLLILFKMDTQDDLFDMPFNLVLQDSQDGEKDLRARIEKDENLKQRAKQQIELLYTEN